MEILIKNRLGEEMRVRLDMPNAPQGLAFILHGFNGDIDQPHMTSFRDAFLNAGYAALSIDATRSINSSAGLIEEFTMEQHLADFEDAIAWASTQDWYQEPFAVAGHSMGGFTCLEFANNNNGRVSLAVPASSVISGDLLWESWLKNVPEEVEPWRKTGWQEVTNVMHPDRTGRIHWSAWEDWKAHDIRQNSNGLTMPVLLITGDADPITPPEDQVALLEALPEDNAELMIIPSGDHVFEGQLDAFRDSITSWLEDVDGGN